MELTQSFLDLLANFGSVFTAPTFKPSCKFATAGFFPHRHRFITDVIFSGGNVANGHWSRFHRFFSDAAWDSILSTWCLALSGRPHPLAHRHYPVGGPRHLVPQTWADHLRHRHAPRPAHLQQGKPLVSWGHDWVVLSMLIVKPFWAPKQGLRLAHRPNAFTRTSRD